MPDVVVVRWPEERDAVARLAKIDAPFLCVVDGDEEPPILTSCLQDWVRLPNDERDVRARIAALELRVALHGVGPFVDDDGLHHAGEVVQLTATQAELAIALAERYGEVVSDHDLLARVIDGAQTHLALRTEIARLRARARHVHLTVRRVSGRGYVLRSPRSR